MTRRTKEEVERQHQGMDRPGIRQVPEGRGEQGKMEKKTGCNIICGAPTTLAVKVLMVMMTISWSNLSEYKRDPFTCCSTSESCTVKRLISLKWFTHSVLDIELSKVFLGLMPAQARTSFQNALGCPMMLDK